MKSLNSKFIASLTVLLLIRTNYYCCVHWFPKRESTLVMYLPKYLQLRGSITSLMILLFLACHTWIDSPVGVQCTFLPSEITYNICRIYCPYVTSVLALRLDHISYSSMHAEWLENIKKQYGCMANRQLKSRWPGAYVSSLCNCLSMFKHSKYAGFHVFYVFITFISRLGRPKQAVYFNLLQHYLLIKIARSRRIWWFFWVMM